VFKLQSKLLIMKASYIFRFKRELVIWISSAGNSSLFWIFEISQTNQKVITKFKMEEAEAVEFSPSYRILEATDESEDDLHHSSGRTK